MRPTLALRLGAILSLPILLLAAVIQSTSAASSASQGQNATQSKNPEILQKAQAGDPYSQFWVGQDNEQRGDFASAISWYRKAAEHGEPHAENALGFLHQVGRGVPQSFPEAVGWYRKAADHGDPNGESNLAKMLEDGTGIAVDLKEAGSWYRKAAESGWAWAQAKLGQFYAEGRGLPQDRVSAYMWTSLAAGAKDHSQWHCAQLLASLAIYMSRTDLAEAKNRAFGWFQRRSSDPKLKHWAAGPNELAGPDGILPDERLLTVHIGLLYAEGLGVPRDDSEALRWYRLGAERADAPAESSLGERYYLGKGVPKDYRQAFELFMLSAEQGFALGQHNLATCFLQGIGTAKNELEAVKWFRKGAEQGHGGSLHDLAAMYAMGTGVPKDTATAYMWLRIASAAGVKDPNQYALAAEMTKAQLSQANLRAAEWFKAHDDDSRFQTELAYMYFIGEGVPKDPVETAKWARRGAENGNARAQYLLGLSYTAGKGVPKDAVEAIRWFRLAAEQGNADAQTSLAGAYAPSHTRYPHPKPLPAITYENMGGRGCIARVHISLNLKHLAFSSHQHFNASTLQRSHDCPRGNFRPLAPALRTRMSLTRLVRSSS